MKTRRGRPRLYDADAAIQAAGEVFWSKGFSASSLDELSSAMNMNRPSIYKAFGDKEAIYRQVMMQFVRHMEAGFQRTLAREPDFRKGLRKFYQGALDVYTADDTALGCLVMCTAPAAAMDHPGIQADLRAVIEQIDAQMSGRVEEAIKQGQLDANLDPKTLSRLLQAILHSLAIRARAGESRNSLRRFIDASIALLLGND